MPELPEIETLRLGLEKYLIGHKILDVEIKIPKMFQGDTGDVVGAKVEAIRRIGKGIIIELNNDFVMAVHLKLTGQLVYSGKQTQGIHLSEKIGGALPAKHTHVIFNLDKGAKLFYNDLRRFGWIKVLNKDEVLSLPFFKDMGPEPFVTKVMDGKLLTLEYFREIIKKGNLAVKIFLMDQKRIGGIGNIYANDALNLAKINPTRKAKTLKDEEIKKLYDAIFAVLKEGLKYGGSSDVNYVHADGTEGNYQEHALVYGKKGKKCSNCKGIIKKTYLGGRGTYYCSLCQK